MNLADFWIEYTGIQTPEPNSPPPSTCEHAPYDPCDLRGFMDPAGIPRIRASGGKKTESFVEKSNNPSGIAEELAMATGIWTQEDIGPLSPPSLQRKEPEIIIPAWASRLAHG